MTLTDMIKQGNKIEARKVLKVESKTYKHDRIERDNDAYFNTFLKGTYPTNGKPDCLQTFHHHMLNRLYNHGQVAILVNSRLVSLLALYKRGEDIEQVIHDIENDLKLITRTIR